MQCGDGRKTTRLIRGITPEIQRRAKEMRASMTPAESRLWESLRGRQLDGLRFRAQHPVGQFILDFYCPARKLVVEVDGSSHDTNAERDEERTAHLADCGYCVVRVRNDEVEHDIDGVLDRIRRAAAGGYPG